MDREKRVKYLYRHYKILIKKNKMKQKTLEQEIQHYRSFKPGSIGNGIYENLKTFERELNHIDETGKGKRWTSLEIWQMDKYILEKTIEICKRELAKRAKNECIEVVDAGYRV